MDKALGRLAVLIAVADPGRLPRAAPARPRRRRPRRPAPHVGVGRAARHRDGGEPRPRPRRADRRPGHRLGRQAGRRRDPLVLLPRRRRRPEQVEVEQKVAEDFNASHPGIHLRFEGYRLRSGARRAVDPDRRPATGRTSSVRSASVAPRRSTASGSTSSRSSTRTSYDMSQFPDVDRRPLQRRWRGSGRHPVRDLSVGPVLQGEPVQGGRARRAAARVERHVHDARRLDRAVGLRHRPQDRDDADRRQERQGRDRGRLRPGEHRPVGLRAAA